MKVSPAQVHMSLAALVLAVALCYSGSGQLLDADLDEITRRFTVMVDCPERVWPNFNWGGLQVALVDSARGTAFLWNDLTADSLDRHKAVPIPIARFPRLAPGNYQFAKFRSQPTLVLGVDPAADPDAAVFTAIHESFHFIGPTVMAKPDRRGFVYPEDWQPHYYRHQIIDALNRAATDRQTIHLAAAAYWQAKLAEEYPEMVNSIRKLDLVEGAAQYVATLGISLSAVGCDADDPKLWTYVVKHWKENRGQVMDRDFESYELGRLVGLLLQMFNKSGWQGRAEAGEDMLDILLEDVRAKPQRENRRLARKVQQFYELENLRLGREVDDFIQKISSRDYILIAIPEPWRLGSFSARDFVRFTHQDNVFSLTLERTAEYGHPETHQQMQITGQNTGVVRGACDDSQDYVFFPVARQDLVLHDDGTYSAATTAFRASRFNASEMRIAGLGMLLCLR